MPLAHHVARARAQADVYVYLQKKLEDNFTVIAQLERHIVDSDLEKERAQVAGERAHKSLEEATSAEIARLGSALRAANDELLAVSEFRANKERIEARMAELEGSLVAALADKEHALAQHERKFVAEKEALKQQMFAKMVETKQALLATTQERLSDATKRAIAENEQITGEIMFQTHESERLLAMNAELLAKNAVLQREREVRASAVCECRAPWGVEYECACVRACCVSDSLWLAVACLPPPAAMRVHAHLCARACAAMCVVHAFARVRTRCMRARWRRVARGGGWLTCWGRRRSCKRRQRRSSCSGRTTTRSS